MLKKGNVVSDAYDDYEVRTSASQNRVTATVCTEEFFLRTQYIYIALPSFKQRVGGGGGRN
jgi:hypothetical protein